MDLVVGATGIVGKRIAVRLSEKGRKVRAMVRGGAARAEAQELAGAGIEIVEADLTKPGSLPAACAGIENVACTATSMPHGRDDGLRRADRDGVLALIEAADRAKVKKFVYTSYSGNIRYDSPLETAKRDCENKLLASSMQAVVLRPSYFMEAWLSPALGFDPAKASARIYGSGQAKVSYISAHDVVEFAVAAVAMSEGDRAVILEMGGPEALSQLDAVRVFEKKLGKKFTLDFVPVEALEGQYRSSDPLQKTFGALMLGYAKGDVNRESRANADRYGVRLRSVADYATSFH
jgi:NADH dehydrogenase